MTIKHLCDACGIEIDRNYVSERYTPTKWFRDKYLNITLEVQVKKEKTWNDGDLCFDCLKAVFEAGE